MLQESKNSPNLVFSIKRNLIGMFLNNFEKC